jgi:hypothetical protein
MKKTTVLIGMVCILFRPRRRASRSAPQVSGFAKKRGATALLTFFSGAFPALIFFWGSFFQNARSG